MEALLKKGASCARGVVCCGGVAAEETEAACDAAAPVESAAGALGPGGGRAVRQVRLGHVVCKLRRCICMFRLTIVSLL